ncbi:MAG: SDR family NAD(P)-dependent oxidoreductase [Pseudomonadota bacterium]|nr:SDR family NAD(P)-dependent oxidoreductase [Pseudomonadota bacterium]
MHTYIITGATGGLGLATALRLSQRPDTRVVLAVRDADKARRLTRHWQHPVQILPLDLANLSAVDRFVEAWDTPIAGLMNNAGIQIVDSTRFTPHEGFEETMTVNHLAALKLTQGLLPHLHQGRVLFVGSGSHHPKNFTAGMFGFRGAQFESVASSIRGEVDDSNGKSVSLRQAGMDRYATSKFLNMVTTVELAKRIPQQETAVYCLDPGLMAGTGLVRTQKAVEVFGWKYILPLLAWLLPESSTTQRSAEAATWILAEPHGAASGTLFSFNKKPAKGIWEKVFDPQLGQRVVDDSLALMEE